jgi:glycosyltransferase involved in cell wall biosynthesis
VDPAALLVENALFFVQVGILASAADHVTFGITVDHCVRDFGHLFCQYLQQVELEHSNVHLRYLTHEAASGSEWAAHTAFVAHLDRGSGRGDAVATPFSSYIFLTARKRGPFVPVYLSHAHSPHWTSVFVGHMSNPAVRVVTPVVEQQGQDDVLVDPDALAVEGNAFRTLELEATGGGAGGAGQKWRAELASALFLVQDESLKTFVPACRPEYGKTSTPSCRSRLHPFEVMFSPVDWESAQGERHTFGVGEHTTLKFQEVLDGTGPAADGTAPLWAKLMQAVTTRQQLRMATATGLSVPTGKREVEAHLAHNSLSYLRQLDTIHAFWSSVVPAVAIWIRREDHIWESRSARSSLEWSVPYVYGASFTVDFTERNFGLGRDRDGYLVIDTLTSRSEFYDTQYIQLKDVLPGTHFFSAQLFQHQGQAVSALAKLLVEKVYTKDILASAQYFFASKNLLQQEGRHPKYTPPQPMAVPNQNMKVTLVGTLKFDGQKSIWLQQIEKIPASTVQWSYIMFANNPTADELSGPFARRLEQLNVPMMFVPLSTPMEDLVATFTKLQITQKIDGTSVLNLLVEYADQVDPNGVLGSFAAFQARVNFGWMRDFWESLVQAIASTTPDVLVFANARDISDKVLVRAARYAQVPSLVMDLPNLYPVRPLQIDMIVAPSHFAKQHHSVQPLLEHGVPCTVVNPGVDVHKFVPPSSSKDAPNLVAPKPVVIGFVGRLAAEKSPGLVLYCAKYLLETYPDITFQFKIIGDGVLLPYLKQLASELHIADHLEFCGGIYEGLPKAMQEIDIMLSPSLRDEAETFCIVNVESMATAIPIVSFAVGGIGEYLVDGHNGVVVTEASAEALANAIIPLARNQTLREMLGNNGREMAASAFTIQHTVGAYANIYSNLVDENGRYPLT